jgi:hypothetical protein
MSRTRPGLKVGDSIRVSLEHGDTVACRWSSGRGGIAAVDAAADATMAWSAPPGLTASIFVGLTGFAIQAGGHDDRLVRDGPRSTPLCSILLFMTLYLNIRVYQLTTRAMDKSADHRGPNFIKPLFEFRYIAFRERHLRSFGRVECSELPK